MQPIYRAVMDANWMTQASLVLGVCAVGVSVAQLALLRRLNLMPMVIGGIAITFFTSLFGQTMGLLDTVITLWRATPQERQVLLPNDTQPLMMPLFLAFALLILATLLGSIAAMIRANQRPKPGPLGTALTGEPDRAVPQK
jgi:hypothetical protein